jgi:LacI family transcriptional regulator/LacI family repressor for deo operon, udp, cdd, tsx, nupC, and nupG
MDAVEALSYQPNHAARSLRTRSRTLGLVLNGQAPGLADPALAELVSGLSEGAAARGYYLLLASVAPSQPEPALATGLARTGRVDGVVLLDLRVDDERAVALAEAGVPCVSAGTPDEPAACPTVGLDLARAAEEGVRHLAGLGHRRIGLIALPSEFADSEPFYRGFVAGLEAAGIEPDPALIVEAGTSEQDGIAAMQELLAAPEPPSAVLAASDALAFGAMHALRDAGLEAGRELSLVGCGDLPLAAHVHPPLTTLRAPRRSLGAALARRLADLIERKAAPANDELLRLQLIIRRTTAPFPMV